MGEYSLVLLSGGVGKRMKLDMPKQFLLLAGKPLFVHVLEKVDRLQVVKEIIMPCPSEFIEKTEEIINKYGFTTPIKCVEGGGTRQESVFKGLHAADFDNVIIHESVRPFVSEKDFMRLIETSNENAIFGLDIPFTVLRGGDVVEGNLERDELLNVQLPHKFNAKKLLYAHQCAAEDSLNFTEDASLYFHYFRSDIAVLPGSEYNIKITKPIDRILAEAIYKETILLGD